ncbi:MAG: sulfotransferase [Acidithiobacillus sp.]
MQQPQTTTSTSDLPPAAQALADQAVAAHQRGDLAAALAGYRQALAQAPDHPQLHYLAGAALLVMGQPEQAEARFHDALRAAPQHPEARLQLGLLRYSQGDYASAIEHFLVLTTHAPQDARGWINLAAAATLAGRIDLMEPAARQAVQLAPQQADAWNNLGRALQTLGEAQQAEAAYRKALTLAPANGGICFNLADTLRHLGRLSEAEAMYRQSLALDATQANVWTNYGNLLLQQRRLAEARDAYERALQLHPEHPEALANVCGLDVSQGNERSVVKRLRPLVQAHRASIEQVCVYALAERTLGNLDAAEAALVALGTNGTASGHLGGLPQAQALPNPTPGPGDAATILRAIASHPVGLPKQLISAWLELALEHAPLRQPAAAALRAWIDANGAKTPNTDLASMWNLLAQLLDKHGDYPAAFQAALRGKAYNPDRGTQQADTALFTALRHAFTPARLQQQPYGLANEQRPAFIVGLPRSGTSLLEQMLGCHPQVYAAGELAELGFITEELSPQRSADWPQRAVALEVADLAALAQRYLHVLPEHARQGYARITDKMPHNFMRLGLIHLLFPRARIIHIRRDPRDVALSILFHQFDGHHPYANTLDDLAQHILFHARCMAHWRASLPPGVLYELHYEDLVADPRAQIAPVLDHLGLPWDEAVLSPQESARTVLTSSRFQVKEPIHQRARGRWRRYERQLQPLIAALAPLLQPDEAPAASMAASQQFADAGPEKFSPAEQSL